jgi:hypothetical protein
MVSAFAVQAELNRRAMAKQFAARQFEEALRAIGREQFRDSQREAQG